MRLLARTPTGGVAGNEVMRRRAIVQATVIFIVLSYNLVPKRLHAQCGSACTSSDCPRVERSYRQGRWFVSETANFQVCCEDSDSTADNLSRHAESLRTELQAKWLGDISSAAWNPRCQILLYSSKQRYVAAVGRGSEQTVGSSLVDVNKDRITKRRIDLLGQSTEYLSAALPHELTHVVLRDRFMSTAPPRWADEGMATLADTDAKQLRHFNDLSRAIAKGTTFRAGALLAMDGYPQQDRFGAFYGESVSLTKYLVARGTPQQFVEFIELASSDGYEAALLKSYRIAGPGELDRQWRKSLKPIQLVSYSAR